LIGPLGIQQTADCIESLAYTKNQFV